jgi:diadenosine tetraphosphate (Ap4A) HIT family hydrolase
MSGCDMCDGKYDSPPGGLVWQSPRWVVDHCVGPLGIGTLIVKPTRHVIAVGDLDDAEALELGELLRNVAAVVKRLAEAEQVYVTLWSHAAWEPGHIHWIVQPVPPGMREVYSHPGPTLQHEMFERAQPIDVQAAAVFAGRARDALAATTRR